MAVVSCGVLRFSGQALDRTTPRHTAPHHTVCVLHIRLSVCLCPARPSWQPLHAFRVKGNDACMTSNAAITPHCTAITYSLSMHSPAQSCKPASPCHLSGTGILPGLVRHRGQRTGGNWLVDMPRALPPVTMIGRGCERTSLMCATRQPVTDSAVLVLAWLRLATA